MCRTRSTPFVSCSGCPPFDGMRQSWPDPLAFDAYVSQCPSGEKTALNLSSDENVSCLVRFVLISNSNNWECPSTNAPYTTVSPLGATGHPSALLYMFAGDMNCSAVLPSA